MIATFSPECCLKIPYYPISDTDNICGRSAVQSLTHESTTPTPSVTVTTVCPNRPYNIQRLQSVAYRTHWPVAFPKLTASSPADILHSLHWLPVQYRLNYKLSLMTFNRPTLGLHHQEPQNLATCLRYYRPVRALRSSDDPSHLGKN